MRLIIFTTFVFFISFSSFSQVNRYTAPPPVAKYNPMTFNELLFAPTIKSKKSDENFQKLISLHSKVLAYVEVYKEEFDEKFNNEIVDFATKFDEILKGDLSSKEYEIQKLEFSFEKIQRDFENRLKNKSSAPPKSYSPQRKREESNAPTKVVLGSPVYSMPILARESSNSKIIGYTKRYNYQLLEKYDEKFHKIKIEGKLGYISSNWINEKWR
ncbi:hypothetical protein [Algoriphagus sp.]|uniref:hypothetical protein n=1 Tax=Algoriphagus sp. TaxID=1872435 RepID=UPI00260BBBB3|nr:hypothetical protein [Algoriphagus sp.]